MKNKGILFGSLIAGLVLVAFSCTKDDVTVPVKPPAAAPPPVSFVEEFDNVGDLASKGWVFKNNSVPIGQNGWRQGRYEAATGAQYKFLNPVPFYGFPAHSASATPNDFISCDVTAGNDVNGAADYSAFLISPQLPLKNGDRLIFYTRAVDDANYSIYTRDRMQVLANYTDGTASVGNTKTSVGGFTRVLLDINPNYVNNDPGGYPRIWRKYTYTFAGIPGDSVMKGRFAFRYLASDAGIFGGISGNNYPSCVGIDSLAYIHN